LENLAQSLLVVIVDAEVREESLHRSLNLSLLIEISQVLEGLAHLTPFFFLLLEGLPSEYLKEGVL
jgi:hypothetical protein